MSDQDDEGYWTPRRKYLVLAGGIMTGGLSIIGGVTTYLIEQQHEESERFSRSASKGIEDTVNELSDEQYDRYNTDFQDISSNLTPASKTARLNIHVDAVEANPQELADQLSEGDYLEEGAEIFGIYASNLLETEELRHLELGFKNGILTDPVWYEVEASEIDPEIETEAELRRFYRETVDTNMRTG